MKQVKTVLFFLMIFLLLMFSFSLNWTGDHFGGIGFDEIMFHLHTPLKGTGLGYISSYLQKVVVPAVGITVELVIACFIIPVLLNVFPSVKKSLARYFQVVFRHSTVIGILVIAVWFSAAAFRAQRWFGLFDYVKSLVVRSSFLEEEYVNPADVEITFPEKKRNLIYIFVESGETSTQDTLNGGLMSVNYIPEMTEIAKQNVSFSHSELLEGASVAPLCGWTVSGMVAETAGLPMASYSLRDNALDRSGEGLSDDQNRRFMPGVTAIGDILEQEGYHNVFMAGSDFEYAGRAKYCSSHGNYTILDYNVAVERGIIPRGYRVWWGFEDRILFDWAREELTELASAGEPFNFTMLTVDTHCQDGYICSLCENTYPDQYANVWRCASRQIGEFVSWVQEQPWYDNTVIVICGDHCSMDTDFYGDYGFDRINGETKRLVYNAILNPVVEPVQEKSRQFTTLDLFPTTLAALGAEIEGDHLALGVNLFSGEQTLAEKYGYEYMFGELGKKSLFYDRELLYPDNN